MYHQISGQGSINFDFIMNCFVASFIAAAGLVCCGVCVCMCVCVCVCVCARVFVITVSVLCVYQISRQGSLNFDFIMNC